MKYNVAVIISCFNEEENVEKIYKKLVNELKKSKKIDDYKIYFINDVSTDSTLENIEKLMKKDKKVTLINFKRRMGKSLGLQAGFNEVSKDIDLVFMMDADLQDDPKEIDRFIEKIEEGYDVVSGYKQNRLDNLEKKPASALNYKKKNKIKNLKTLNYNYKFRI